MHPAMNPLSRLVRSLFFSCRFLPAAALLVLFAIGADAADSRPNILFIMTDQQHAGMMSCTGNRNVNTPALDGLAAAGVRFERAYAANPVCVPSRVSLQTGRMPSVIGMGWNDTAIPVPDEMCAQSLAPLLRRAGYRCAYGGKVHLPGDLTKYIFREGEGYERLTADDRGELAKACASFLRQPHEQPFFLFASFINPHDICYMAINDFARSKKKKAHGNVDSQTCEEILDQARKSPDLAAFIRENCPPLPANFEPPEKEPEIISTDYVPEGSFKEFARKEWSEDMWRLHRWLYARLTERVDAWIGQVLRAVADAGLAEETLIIFTSDHGDMDGAHRMEHKGVLYEEATRIPFLVSWKGKIPAGVVDDTHLVSNGLDLLPTLCDYAAAEPPAGLPGRSLRPLLEAGAGADWRDFLVVESRHGRMVRTDRFKYSLYESGARREMLTDLRNDPGEMVNLAEDPDFRELLETHRGLLREWVRAQGDTMAEPYLP